MEQQIRMKNLNKSLIFKISLPFIFSAIFALGWWVAAYAMSAGYFTGSTFSPSGSGTYVLPQNYYEKGMNIAIPTSVNSVDTFVNFIYDYNTNGNMQKKSGSAFIVCTMLGQTFNGCQSSGFVDANRSVTSSGWSEIRARLIAPNISIDWNVGLEKHTYYTGFLNSQYGTNQKDDFTYISSHSETNPDITFYSNGSAIYRLFRSCANPIGTLPGLPTPPAQWSAEPGVTLYVNGNYQFGLGNGASSGDRTIDVNVGDRVGWRNQVTFSNGSASVQYSAEKGVDWGGSIYGGSTTINVDRALLSEELGNKDKLIEAGDAGKTFCLWTHIDRSSQDGPAAGSGRSCVYVRPNWNISATSSADKTIAAPGQRITWTHDLKNDGPSNTTDRVYSRINIKGISIWPAGTDWAGAYTEGGQGIGVIRHITDYSIYDVTQDEVGKDLCEQILFQRIDNGSYGSGNEVCVNIPYSYTLTPIVSINPKDVVEDGSSFTVTSSIKNDGATKSKPSNWSLTETVKYPNGSTRSTTNVGGAGNVIFDQNSTKIVATLTPAASGEAGTQYCYTLKAYPKSGVDDGEISATACITIGKKPKVQIIGGNLSAGGLVNTSTSVKNSRMFGSWTEYGIFAIKDISGMASGSAFASNNGLASYSVCNYSTLSFTNVKTGASTCSGNTGTIGNYVGANTVSNVAASFPGGNIINDSSVSANNLVSGSGVYVGNKAGDLTLSSSTLSAGKSVILKVSGTVTIAGDQYYENKTYTNAVELPQLIIIANNINILDSVTNIDAWLIANNGNINTCSNFSGVLTTDKCSQKLTINGPVSSKKLFLNRTAGSDTGVNSGDPAEVFNLRADVYLWAAAYAKLNNKIQSVYTTELPPRF